MRKIFALVIIALLAHFAHAAMGPDPRWRFEWPKTNFKRSTVSFSEIRSGGPPKDGIPAIDKPKFKTVKFLKGNELHFNISEKEPVIRVIINGDARAYPIKVMTYHEIVNDVVGGTPIAITYCPLCNSAIVFDRRLNGKVLDFGTTGKLRKSNLVMYDRQTESWWQQFTGEAIVGKLAGKELKWLSNAMISYNDFTQAYPKGKVMIPNNFRAKSYGINPYTGYDKLPKPFLFFEKYKGSIPAMARVIVVDKEAWAMELINEKGTHKHKDLVFTWKKGQRSALDTRIIDEGRDIGTIQVYRQKKNGEVEDVVYHHTFAFAFKAFNPDGIIHVK